MLKFNAGADKIVEQDHDPTTLLSDEYYSRLSELLKAGDTVAVEESPKTYTILYVNYVNPISEEEAERKKKELWRKKHPIFSYIYRLISSIGKQPPDE